MSDLERRVVEAIEAAGWDIDSAQHAQTGTIYITASCDGEREPKIRISDHATAHCSEDISLITASGSASPDDHSFDALIEALK